MNHKAFGSLIHPVRIQTGLLYKYSHFGSVTQHFLVRMMKTDAAYIMLVTHTKLMQIVSNSVTVCGFMDSSRRKVPERWHGVGEAGELFWFNEPPQHLF